MVKYWNFHNSSFALRYFFNANGKATVWHIEKMAIEIFWLPNMRQLEFSIAKHVVIEIFLVVTRLAIKICF